MTIARQTPQSGAPHPWRWTFLILLLSAGVVTAAPPNPMETKSEKLVATIDRRIETVWKQNGLEPAASVDDAGYLRRVSLDLIGRVPTVSEARTFFESREANKRKQLVERLLNSPEFARHWATVLRRIWIPQTDTQQFARLISDYESWLSRRLREETPFDELVRQQLNVPVSQVAVRVNPEGGKLGSSAFLAVSKMQPEKLAANSARAFLGINIDCAQCHDHPFARWTRKQFWETAAFFVRPESQKAEAETSLFISVGETEEVVRPKLLNSETIHWPKQQTVGMGRRFLAEWITSPDNPYFARNAVNRIWAEFFGRGFVEPLDDLSGAVAPSHPELLEELSREFADRNFDLRFLIRSVVLSRAYQLSAIPPGNASESDEPLWFSWMPVRALTGEQLYASLRTAAGLPYETRPDRNQYSRSPRQQFAARFLVPRPIHGQRSLVQALTMMNGDLTAQVTEAESSPMLTAVARAPFLSDRERIETLFLAAYSRMPRSAELPSLLKHVETSSDRAAALADIFWAMINSSEFNTNH